MILVNGIHVMPSIFPDGTSQMWHLPEALIKARTCAVTWYFEAEREIIDLLSLKALLPCRWVLHIPYFPYARQDKEVNNDSTFNRSIILRLIRTLEPTVLTTIDIHSPIDDIHSPVDRYNSSYLDIDFVNKIINVEVSDFHQWVIDQFQPNYLVFPDKGAKDRYPYLDSHKCIVFEFEKARNQSTGQLMSHQLTRDVFLPQGKYLMVDDLCDGGATFISIAQQIKDKVPDAQIGLAVTHGLFTKGKEILTEAGIQLFYTDTLLRNKEAPDTEMFRV